MSQAVKQYSGAIQYASEELQNNKDFVLALAKQKPYVLGYASKEIVIEAVKKDAFAFEYASQFRNNKEFILEAVKLNSDVIRHLSLDFLYDKEFILEVVNQNSNALLGAPRDLLEDKKFMLAALNQDAGALEAAKISPYVYEHMSFKMFEDKKFIAELNNVIKEKLTLEVQKAKNEDEYNKAVDYAKNVMESINIKNKNAERMIKNLKEQQEESKEYVLKEI